MTKKFTGLYTALVTPFTNNNAIDYDSLAKLIMDQLAAKVDGLVILGTTGESPVINSEERTKLIKFVVDMAKNKTAIIIGTGSNNTADTIQKSQEAEQLGADGLLIVNPYYNKPTQAGLFNHFSSVAESVSLPVILYNIQGRTAVNLETKYLVDLSKIDNIVAVKEASGNLTQIMDVIHNTPSDFSVLSGDDSLAYPLITLGGDGVVSVLANLLPKQMKQMVNLALNHDLQAALTLHYEMLDLMRAVLTLGSNPMAIKAALAKQNKIQELFRLPLCALDNEQKHILETKLNKFYG